MRKPFNQVPKLPPFFGGNPFAPGDPWQTFDFGAPDQPPVPMQSLPTVPLKDSPLTDLYHADVAYATQPMARSAYNPDSLDYPTSGIEDSPLKAYHYSLIDEWADQSNGRREIEDRIARAVAGQNVAAQVEEDDKSRKGAMVGAMTQQTAHLSDDEFRAYLGRLRDELNSAPQVPTYQQPQMPNALQSGIAFLGSLIDRQHAMDIASTPFLANKQVADERYARDLQTYDLKSKERQRRLGALQDMTQMQSQRDIVSAQLQEGALDRTAQMRGQDMTLQRVMWTDLNASDSVPRLKASIAAIEGSGVELPDDWQQIKADLLSEAQQRQTEKDLAKRDAKSEELVQKYIAKASDPMAPPQARVMNAQIASMMLKEGDPRHAYLEQVMPGLAQLTVQQRKAKAEIERIHTRNAVDKKMADARVQEIGTRRALMGSQVGLNEKRADKLSKELDWMDAEKAMAIAKGYAAVDDLASKVADRHYMFTKEGLEASNATISAGLRTLSAQMNTLRNERARLEALQQDYDPEDAEYKDIQGKIAAIDRTIGTLNRQYNELAGEAKTLRGKLQNMAGGGADQGSPKADATSFMRDWAGTPYQWGGKGKSGIDCSAFACKMLGDVYGVKASGNTTELLKQGTALDVSDPADLRQGDLIFFRNPNGSRHVIVYMGNGLTAEASTSKGVTTRPLTSKRWGSRTTVRRLG